MNNSLHERAARVLGWSVVETRSMSLAMLREMVRPRDPMLASQISSVIQSGTHITRRGA